MGLLNKMAAALGDRARRLNVVRDELNQRALIMEGLMRQIRDEEGAAASVAGDPGRRRTHHARSTGLRDLANTVMDARMTADNLTIEEYDQRLWDARQKAKQIVPDFEERLSAALRGPDGYK